MAEAHGKENMAVQVIRRILREYGRGMDENLADWAVVEEEGATTSHLNRSERWHPLTFTTSSIDSIPLNTYCAIYEHWIKKRLFSFYRISPHGKAKVFLDHDIDSGGKKPVASITEVMEKLLSTSQWVHNFDIMINHALSLIEKATITESRGSHISDELQDERVDRLQSLELVTKALKPTDIAEKNTLALCQFVEWLEIMETERFYLLRMSQKSDSLASSLRSSVGLSHSHDFPEKSSLRSSKSSSSGGSRGNEKKSVSFQNIVERFPSDREEADKYGFDLSAENLAETIPSLNVDPLSLVEESFDLTFDEDADAEVQRKSEGKSPSPRKSGNPIKRLQQEPDIIDPSGKKVPGLDFKDVETVLSRHRYKLMSEQNTALAPLNLQSESKVRFGHDHPYSHKNPSAHLKKTQAWQSPRSKRTAVSRKPFKPHTTATKKPPLSLRKDNSGSSGTKKKYDENEPLGVVKDVIETCFPGLKIPTRAEKQLLQRVNKVQRQRQERLIREYKVAKNRQNLATQTLLKETRHGVFKREYDHYLEWQKRKAREETSRLRKISFQERSRAVKRMEKHQDDATLTARQRELRHQYKEEQFATKLLKHLESMSLNYQKDEEAKRRDDRRLVERDWENRRQAVQNFYRTQCEALGQTLKEKRAFQKLSEKDKLKAIRQYYSDEKRAARLSIASAKARLAVADEDAVTVWRAADGERLLADLEAQERRATSPLHHADEAHVEEANYETVAHGHVLHDDD